MSSKRRLAWYLVAFGLLACTGLHRFPLREPLLVDDDERPFAPAPREYVGTLAWDGANETVFRPISRFFAVDPGGRAANVNALDEVADSSWFTNRIGRAPMTPAELVRGSCGPPLDPNAPDSTWTIDEGKPSGASKGFRVKLPDGRKFLLKADSKNEPYRATGATTIASRLYHAAGYFVPCDSVVYFRRELLKLKPGLVSTDNFGTTRRFDQAALDQVLAEAVHRDGLVRMSASEWLSGQAIGPFRFWGTRDDDPNDVVPHQDRRELRAFRLLAAWLNHFDEREQNTLDIFVRLDPKDPHSRGHVRHHLIDFADSLGSTWVWDAVTRRWGHAYFWDFGYMTEDFLTLGAIERPWDRAQRDGGVFAYFSARDFDAELWRPEFPNPAFGRMAEQDGAWMARIVARFTDQLVAAAVGVGQFDPASTQYLIRTLIQRRDAILRRYLGRVSPLADVRAEHDQLCALDLARSAGVAQDDLGGFDARLYAGPSALFASRLPVAGFPKGVVCAKLSHTAADGGSNEDDPSRYQVVDVFSRNAPGPLRAHLLDLGPRRGFRLVGIERPESVSPPG